MKDWFLGAGVQQGFLVNASVLISFTLPFSGSDPKHRVLVASLSMRL